MLGGVGESVLFSNKQRNKQTNKQKEEEEEEEEKRKKKKGGGGWTRHKSETDTRVHTYFETNVQKSGFISRPSSGECCK